MRSGFVLAAAMLPGTALASGAGQTATGARPIAPADLPAGWRHSVEQGADTYLKGGDRADGLVMAKELPAATTADADGLITRLFPTLGCAGTPPASRDGSVAPFGNERRCFATFARSPGGYRIAVGAATTPRAEAEGVALARRLTAADGAVAEATPAGSAADTATVDAALAAALDAVPPRNLPVHMTLRQGWRYAGDHIQLDYKLWMLFADGFATSCTRWDPAKLAPTAQALAPLVAEVGCKTGRWRPVAGGAKVDDGTDNGPTSLEDGPPPARGITYAGYFDSSSVLFSSLGDWGVPGNVVIDSSAMSLTADGRFRLGTERFDRNNLNSTTTRDSVTGRYLIDRYLMAVAVNGKVERHWFHALAKPTEADILFYFDGKLLRTR